MQQGQTREFAQLSDVSLASLWSGYGVALALVQTCCRVTIGFLVEGLSGNDDPALPPSVCFPYLYCSRVLLTTYASHVEIFVIAKRELI